MSTKEKYSEELLLEEEVLKQNEIVLFNDDVNTFDHVIETLIYACDHMPEQAEQCAFITHYKGKCDVKNGVFEELSFMKHQLDSKGLTVTIE